MAKNLATATKTEVAREVSETTSEFEQQLKNDGYSGHTVKACCSFLTMLEKRGINILNPEEIKKFIAEQNWTDHSKATRVVHYGIFARTMRIQWNPPKYRYEQKIPWIPLEKEVDDLIAGSGKIIAVYLRLLKETGMRCGEALRLTWKDVDMEKSSIAVNNPEKGSLPRILPISSVLKSMLNSLRRKHDRIFPATMDSMQSNFRMQRNRLALKLGNPRLKQISFHTFRHFYATMLYAKTLNILRVQQSLGHKNINNTQIYTHLIDFKSEEYEVQIAETVEESKKLREAGFEHYDTIGNQHLYSRRK
jgi:integrase